MNKPNYSFQGQENIVSPQLVYYPAIIRENIRKMIDLAGGPQRLWPHIKTHKMEAVVKMQMDMGINRFKCATVAEAEMAARVGAAHLILAYPLVGPNIGRFITLMQTFPGTQFYAIGDDTHQIELLGQAAQAQGLTASVLMDADMGQHRTGVPMDQIEEKYACWVQLPGIHMCGMHCYDGHRHENDVAVRADAVRPVDAELEAIKANLTAKGLDCSILVMGGTPSFPCHAEMTDEFLSPGTCVIQDAGYQAAYPDLDFVPGAAVLTRVVSRPSRTTFTLDMGVKGVASDPSGPRAVVAGMEYAKVVIHNEEHWVLEVPEEHVCDIPPIGAEVFAIPTHVCPTSALYPAVPAVEDGKVTEWWTVSARDRKISI